MIIKIIVNNFIIQNSRNLRQGYQTKLGGTEPLEQKKTSAGFAILIMSRTQRWEKLSTINQNQKRKLTKQLRHFSSKDQSKCKTHLELQRIKYSLGFKKLRQNSIKRSYSQNARKLVGYIRERNALQARDQRTCITDC